MVFTRKDGDFHGRTVSLPEGEINLQTGQPPNLKGKLPNLKATAVEEPLFFLGKSDILNKSKMGPS